MEVFAILKVMKKFRKFINKIITDKKIKKALFNISKDYYNEIENEKEFIKRYDKVWKENGSINSNYYLLKSA